MSKDIGRIFMEKTKHKYLGESDQMKNLPQPPLELEYNPNQELIDLPSIDSIKVKDMGLREAIASRKSLRKYSSTPLTLEELAYLLWCTQGVKKVTSRPATIRTVPSAGARHAFETYL